MTLASDNAHRVGVTVNTHVADLDTESLPNGPWDVIVKLYFLKRALIPRIIASLAPGGVFLWVHPTRTNLRRHARPSARFLLDDGEAERSIADLVHSHDVQIIECREGWQNTDRHESIVVLKRRVQEDRG